MNLILHMSEKVQKQERKQGKERVWGRKHVFLNSTLALSHLAIGKCLRKPWLEMAILSP